MVYLRQSYALSHTTRRNLCASRGEEVPDADSPGGSGTLMAKRSSE